jgi:type I restriction enzyme S subunit
MIEELKPFPEYKASGVPWLGQVPSHWEISRSKRLFSARKDLALPGDVQLSATQAYGVIPQSEFEERVGRRVVRISMHLDKRRHVERDDFVISMRSFQGGLERAWASGAIRSSYVVLKPGAGIAIGYFAYLFKSDGYIRALQATASFIRDGQDLNFSNFARVDLPLPPLDEQAAMGRFLRHASLCIDRVIRSKRKLIALLKEQKQAIIYRAVTRGLNPNAPMTDSGVPWLREIPAHWEVRKIKYIVRAFGGMTPRKNASTYWNGNIPWVSPKDMKVSVIRDSRDHISKMALTATNISLVPAPAVLIVVRGMILARTFPTAVTAVPVTVNQDMKALVPKSDVEADFLALLLSGIEREVLMNVEESGHGTRCLRTDAWANMELPLPPLCEQSKIKIQVESSLADVNRLLRSEEDQLSLLREYRTRLIADIVTGQLDVREAAARLPPEEPEEPGTTADDNEEPTDDDLVEDDPG